MDRSDEAAETVDRVRRDRAVSEQVRLRSEAVRERAEALRVRLVAALDQTAAVHRDALALSQQARVRHAAAVRAATGTPPPPPPAPPPA